MCLTVENSAYGVRTFSHLSPLKVLNPSDLSFNQVIAVDGGGNSHFGQAAAYELQHGHLGRGILHGHPVWSQAQISATTVNLLPCWIIQVAVNDLLRQSERPVQPGGSGLHKTGRTVVFVGASEQVCFNMISN